MKDKVKRLDEAQRKRAAELERRVENSEGQAAVLENCTELDYQSKK